MIRTGEAHANSCKMLQVTFRDKVSQALCGAALPALSGSIVEDAEDGAAVTAADIRVACLHVRRQQSYELASYPTAAHQGIEPSVSG